jgi:hypothetical protein
VFWAPWRGFALAAHGEVARGDRAQLSEIVQAVRGGRLRPNIGNVSALGRPARLDEVWNALDPESGRFYRLCIANGPDGEAMFRHACAMGLQGIVSKRADRPYRSGRCAYWLKVKNPAYERPGAVE